MQTRREFLNMLEKVAVVTFTAISTGTVVSNAAKRITGLTTGNAGVNEYYDNACADTPDPDKCVKQIILSPREEFNNAVLAPVAEEIIFRAIPSTVTSMMQHPLEARKIARDVIVGTNNWGLSTRRELIVGVVSSALFGAAHNLTDEGFDTQVLPINQTVSGLGFWALQRKYGISANIFGHTLNNLLAIGAVKFSSDR